MITEPGLGRDERRSNSRLTGSGPSFPAEITYDYAGIHGAGALITIGPAILAMRHVDHLRP